MAGMSLKGNALAYLFGWWRDVTDVFVGQEAFGSLRKVEGRNHTTETRECS